jgi:L-ascorbate metabolism protein UlaG (beta-lactamase superfamily)
MPTTTGPTLKLTFLRTSCVLIECGGLRILTDPFFASTMRGLPVFRPPGIALADLPRIDVILASHLHRDHFDRAAVRRIAHPGLTVVTCPGARGHIGAG